MFRIKQFITSLMMSLTGDRRPPAGDITGGAEGVVEPVDGDLHHLPQRLVLCTRHRLEDGTEVRGQHTGKEH